MSWKWWMRRERAKNEDRKSVPFMLSGISRHSVHTHMHTHSDEFLLLEILRTLPNSPFIRPILWIFSPGKSPIHTPPNLSLRHYLPCLKIYWLLTDCSCSKSKWLIWSRSRQPSQSFTRFLRLDGPSFVSGLHDSIANGSVFSVLLMRYHAAWVATPLLKYVEEPGWQWR